MKKLKPCPFCNGEAEIIISVGRTNTFPYIECTKCKAYMGSRNSSWSADKGQLNFETEEEAIKMWNTRGGKLCV